MAEAVGLTIGIIALAGTFKDCIDLFGYLSASRNLGRDYELLDTKLDIEKTLLLQWANRVRLCSTQYDRRLVTPSIKPTVSRLLAGIQMLLSDSQALQQRYGMQPKSEILNTNTATTKPEPSQTLSSSAMAIVMQDFRRLTIQQANTNKNTVGKKIRWAVHDKEKFQCLIQELSYLISKLSEIVPDTSGTFDTRIQEDLQKLDFDKLRTVLMASTGTEALMAGPAEEAIKENCKERILQRLWYRVIDDRRISLRNADSGTLSWALRPPKCQVEMKWDDLSRWLAHDSGIYWVSGKAGSGKSTLMKYLYESAKTEKLLQSWAGGSDLTIANFFFYALGTHEQKSQEGLTRALLYQILSVEQSLVEVLVPGMWKEANTSGRLDLTLPSAGETKLGFEKFSEGLGKGRKFCFFIDGLDEYAGSDMDSILSFVENLANNANVKVIVSSRPIPLCVQAFFKKPKLQLQDLTKPDIQKYINNTIGSHPYMKLLASNQFNPSEEIVSALVEKASGIFLWVVLARRSLIAGFAAYDNAAELLKRIDDLPPELEDLFSHMLKKIEPRYQVQAAKLLRVCYQSHHVASDPLPTLGLAMLDKFDFSNTVLARGLSNVDRRIMSAALEARLRSRCCGLLEVSRILVWNHTRTTHSFEKDCFCNLETGGTHDELVDSTVTFIHRTVFDFLGQPGVLDNEFLQVHDSDFDPDTILSWIFLQLISSSSYRKSDTQSYQQTLRCVRQFFVHAAHADNFSPITVANLLSKLEELPQGLLQDLYAAESQLRSYWRSGYGNAIPSSIIFATETGMVTYIRSKLERENPSEDMLRVLWLYALETPILSFGTSLSMLRCLLSWIDPRAELSQSGRFAKISPWRHWLEHLDVYMKKYGLREIAETTLVFLQAGALGDRTSENCSVEDLQTQFMILQVPYLDRDEMNKVREVGKEIICISKEQLGRQEVARSTKRKLGLGEDGPAKQRRIASPFRILDER